MAVRIRLAWADNNVAEAGHNIYRSDTPMDPDALPASLAELGSDVVEYLDETVTEGQTYYYRVSAFNGMQELVSGEVAVEAAGTEYWLATLGGAGDDVGRGVAVAGDGSIYVVGYTTSQGAGGNDLLLAKYDSTGAIQWQRSLGGSGVDLGLDVIVAGDGSVYITGYTASQGAGGNDLLLAKYDSSGAIQWQRSLGGSGDDQGWGLAIAGDGSVYVTGYTASQGAGGSDLLLSKYDSSGAIQWQRSLGGSVDDGGRGVAVAGDGSVYITGYTASQGAGGNDLLLAKYSASGAIQWQRSLGGSGVDLGVAVTVAGDGSVYVTGYTASQGAAGFELLLAKYSASGAIQWQRSLGGSGTDIGQAVTVAGDGSVYVTGYTASQGAGGSDLLLAKYSASGAIQWQRSLGGSSGDQGFGVAILDDGSVYVTGYTASQGAGGNDLLLVRLPYDGTLSGTYGAMTYQECTLTDSSRTLTDAARTLTAATRTLTPATATLTDAARTLTSTVTTIP